MKRLIHRYFVPHEGNNYKPHILQRAAVVMMLILAVFSFTLANIHSLVLVSSDWLLSAIVPGVLIDLTNDNRREASLTSLSRNPLLDEAARLKAEHMAEESYFAHFSPDGVSPWHWFSEVGYDYLHAGENLAIHFVDSEDVVAAWMDSPGHRENIMNDSYREIGIGTAQGTYEGFQTVFVVQLFGTERIGPPTLEIPRAVAAEPIPTPIVASEEVSNEISRPVEVEEPDSSDMATSVPLLSLQGETRDPTPSGRESNALGRLLTQPTSWLMGFYVGFGALILLALILSVIIEWKRQHPVQIAYGTGLIAVLALMFYVHTLLMGNALVV